MNSTKHILGLLAIAILLCVPAGPLFAIELPPSPPTPTDQSQESGQYVERKFDPERLERYRNDAKYQYKRDKPEPPQRKPKPREERRVSEARPVHYDGPSADLSGLGTVAKVIMWVVMIGIVAFVLLQLLQVNWRGLAKKKSDKAKVVAENEIPIEEDVTKMEFEDLVQKAIDAGNFRVAVRLLYLRALKQLTEQSLINWHREKTNHDYIRELKDKNLRPGFSDVTLIFEYIWYGEFPVNKDDFNLARASFIRFEQTLRQNHAV